MLAEQKKTIGFQAGSRGIGKTKSGVPDKNSTKNIPKLSDLGIDKKFSSRAQKMAQMPSLNMPKTIDNIDKSLACYHSS